MIVVVLLSSCSGDDTSYTTFPDATHPRLVSAVAASNTEIIVTFSQSMEENSATVVSHYRISENHSDATNNNGSGQVVVMSATMDDPTNKSVRLTTLAQSDIEYRLTVSNIFDVNGQPIASGIWPDDPATVIFVGIGPDTTQLADSDGDGLSDAAEQRGWTVIVQAIGGDVTRTAVTSDPFQADTDADGLTDIEEAHAGTNPRSADTDQDTLTDDQEWNKIYSNPLHQDSDMDSLQDGLEFNFFKTSPVLADTDGDQFRDDEELIDLDRNPLIADLPHLQILVGDARLSLKVTSSYTDETGTVQTTEETLQTTFEKSQERLFGTSDTVSNETSLTHGETIGGEVSYSIADGFGAKGSFESTFGQTFANGYTTTLSRESAEASSEEYQNSVSRAFSLSQNRSVTRTVEDAQIVADLSIQNLSDMAFTITNIELSALRQDRRGGNRFIPIAALRLQGANDPTNQPKFNLGPFDPERGPFIFENTGIFPNLVEEIIREPQGLVYRVVNFDLLDEFGRNFVFSSQEVNDRTVGITIDSGNGEVESYRVATHNIFDETGQMLPITMEHALKIAGISRSTALTGDTPNADPNAPETLSTYGTQRDTSDDVEVLTRVRGVQADFAALNPEKRFWAIISANRRVPETVDFSSIELRARDNFLLVFTRDFDQDGLLEREELFYGSNDQFVDTDADTMTDFDEVRIGWSVALKGGSIQKVFSSPASVDTDGDGLTDDQELEFGTDPTRADTDFDGLSDTIEIFGPIEILLFDGDADETNNPILIVPRYQGPPTIVNAFNGICNTTAAGDDVQEIPLGDAAADGQVVVSSGPNELIDTLPNTGPNGSPVPDGDDYVRVAHDQEYLTDPLNRDTDFDGISDGRELFLGVNPNRVDAGTVLDTDNDGLSDDEEDTGWLIVVNGGVPTLVTSDKFRADTDRDGIPDVYERAIGTNPRSRDTDGDTLFDYPEFDPDDEIGIYDGLALADAADRCSDASACFYDSPDPLLLIGTDPRKKDTDGDTRDDDIELTEGWIVKVFGKPESTVFSNPKFADYDSDGLNDGQELTNTTNPNDADTDDDNRFDAAELVAGLNPLRQDYHLKVTLEHLYVIDDCDASTREGLELLGEFNLQTSSENVQLHSEPCHGEEGACEVSACCISEGDGQPCPGEYLEFNKSHTFVFREGEQFQLYTSTLEDNDDYGGCGGALKEDIGSFSQEFTFTLSPTSPFSRQVGGGSCAVIVSYTLIRID